MSNYTARNAKKIPFYVLLGFLTIGASLILGFLSFSGMFALAPVLPLAFAAFVLSVAYEGEIYLQNIKGAFKKLTKSDFVEQSLAKEYLLTYFPEIQDSTPQFFKDYQAQLQRLGAFGHGTLKEADQEKKRRIEKTLGDMEKWFTTMLFNKTEPTTDYAKELCEWLQNNPDRSPTVWQKSASRRIIAFNIAKAFSIISGIFMGFGSIYLIVGALSAIPLLAAIPFGIWPVFVIPMAIIAGTAYGFLTYNSITDMINNNTIGTWVTKLKNSFSHGINPGNVFMVVAASVLGALAVALTVCTAGTWWTVVNNTRPLFDWMRKIPDVIMGVVTPIILGISSVFFIFQNTSDSLLLLEQAKELIKDAIKQVIKDAKHTYNSENIWQLINPFRFILALTILPTRMIMFLGHIISIALTADRAPGIPEAVGASIAMVSEGFEDAHYFIGHQHAKTLLAERLGPGHGHSHDADIPTRIIQLIASPMYVLATIWDWATSQLNPAGEVRSVHTCSHGHHHQEESAVTPVALTFKNAWNKQWGMEEARDVHIHQEPNHDWFQWQKEQSIAVIDRFKEKQLEHAIVNQPIAQEKIQALDALQDQIHAVETTEGLNEALQQAKSNEVWNKHRLFSQSGKTRTQEFVESLDARISVAR